MPLPRGGGRCGTPGCTTPALLKLAASIRDPQRARSEAAGLTRPNGYETPVSRRAETVVLLGAGALIIVLIAVNVMAAQGRFTSEDETPSTAVPAATGEDEDETTREPTGSEPTEEEPATTETETVATETAATTTEARPPPPPRLVLTAARGECYLSVRRGSVAGEVLYDAILPEGGSIDFTGPRIWIRIGASTNLDATLDGEALDLPPGTVDVVVTRAGVESA